jgi:predicted nucleotidyltransferase
MGAVMMLEQVIRQHEEVNELCRMYCVHRLELFGSALTERFDDARSDLDFLVEFEPESPMGPFHQFIDFKIALEQLFDRPVDLVERSAIRNPYFRKAVDCGPRTLLYAA